MKALINTGFFLVLIFLASCKEERAFSTARGPAIQTAISIHHRATVVIDQHKTLSEPLCGAYSWRSIDEYGFPLTFESTLTFSSVRPDGIPLELEQHTVLSKTENGDLSLVVRITSLDHKNSKNIDRWELRRIGVIWYIQDNYLPFTRPLGYRKQGRRLLENAVGTFYVLQHSFDDGFLRKPEKIDDVGTIEYFTATKELVEDEEVLCGRSAVSVDRPIRNYDPWLDQWFASTKLVNGKMTIERLHNDFLPRARNMELVFHVVGEPEKTMAIHYQDRFERAAPDIEISAPTEVVDTRREHPYRDAQNLLGDKLRVLY